MGQGILFSLSFEFQPTTEITGEGTNPVELYQAAVSERCLPLQEVFLILQWFPVQSTTKRGLLKIMELRCYLGKERISTLANLSITRKCGFHHSVQKDVVQHILL